jgi:hypothetical protein
LKVGNNITEFDDGSSTTDGLLTHELAIKFVGKGGGAADGFSSMLHVIYGVTWHSYSPGCTVYTINHMMAILPLHDVAVAFVCINGTYHSTNINNEFSAITFKYYLRLIQKSCLAFGRNGAQLSYRRPLVKYP